ncbi:maestro heat-like repeat-containing protein family member 2B [Elgaria multicarinata webbii]|uniref:maestro heat-like repeat-containing protein family member 2B n=1 Tax=Elgaria multicarinata webbii TaxID=159646 RepID=UPI002FCD5634
MGSEILGYWLVSEREWERSRAIQLCAHLLRARHQRSGASPRIPPGQFSRLAGVLAPFTCDTLGTIRQGAGDCIRVLLSLQGAATPPREPKGRMEEWRLRGIRQDLQSDHAKEVHAASLQLAKVVSTALPSQEIVAFLRALLEQLRAVSGACDQAVLLWFEAAVRVRGADLRDKIRDLVAVVCSSLRHSEDPAQRRCLAQAVCILAERRRKAVCAALLEHPLLHDRARKELWAALATSKSNAAPVLKYLLGRLRAEGSTGPSCVPAESATYALGAASGKASQHGGGPSAPSCGGWIGAGRLSPGLDGPCLATGQPFAREKSGTFARRRRSLRVTGLPSGEGPSLHGSADGPGFIHRHPRERFAALAALREVVLALESCTSLVPLLSELCHALLWKLSRDPDEEKPTPDVAALERKGGLGVEAVEPPRKLAVEVLQTVLSRAIPEAAQELDLGNAWTVLMQPGSSLRGAALLARALVRSENPLLDELLRRLLLSLSAPREACTDLSLVFCMEHTGHPSLQKPEILDLLVRQLLAGARNGDATMRFLSVRGLRNVAEGAPQEAKKHQKALLDTLLLAAGDAASPEVAREGLRALSAVWGCLERRHAAGASQAVASQARAHLQHADEALRAAAFQLFGQLARATQPKCAKPFAKEAGRALAALLLHFRDPSPGVAKACCGAFVACAPFLELQELTADMDAGLVLADVSGARHSRLMDRACQRLAQTDPLLLDAILVEVPQYLRCAWDTIRLAACKLAGILVETVDTQRLGRLDLGQLLQSLHSLGHDPSAAVEIAASEAAQALRRKQEESQAGSDGGQPRGAALSGWFFRRRRRQRRKGSLAALGLG